MDKPREELPKEATPRERIKYIKDLAVFQKAMFSDISYNDLQLFIDKVIKVCNEI